MTAQTHTRILEQVLTLARQAGADAAEAFISDNQSQDVSVRMGQRESLERAESRDISLRVFVDGAQAAAVSSDPTPDALQALAARVVAMARVAPRDPYCGLADPAHIAPPTDMDLCDPTPAHIDQLEDMARRAEDAARAVPGISNSIGAGASHSQGQMTLMTSAGVVRAHTSSTWSVWMTALASGADGVMERDSDWSTGRFAADLMAPEDIGRRAAEKTLRRLDARKLSTRTCPVLFDRDTATRLISPFIGAISGAAVARGVSFLKDKLGQAVFSKDIQIIDDPFIPRGLGSAPFDRESVHRQRRALIDAGVLTTWLMHSAAARQLGLTPTGHASWEAGGPPSISSSNVYMAAGSQSPAEMIRAMGTGVIVTDMFGPSLNSNTGDWSAGASGLYVEDGAIQYPVNEITVAGNLIDIYARLIPASDLQMTERTNVPSLLVDGLTIAGT